MTSTLSAQLLASGLGMGCIFALIAIGLTLIYGVMGVVNFAHGEFLMISMYGTWLAFAFWGVDPLVSLPVVGALMFVFGILAYHVLVRPVIAGTMHAPIFVTFGLVVFLQAGAQFLFGADYYALDKSWLSGAGRRGGVTLPTAPIAAGLGALVATLLLY